MKKWFVLALVVCVAAAVQAGEGKKKSEGKGKGGDVTKEQYVATAKKQAESKGMTFDQAKVEAKFTQLDKNGDGKLSADEKPQQKGKKDGKKGGEKPKKSSADSE